MDDCRFDNLARLIGVTTDRRGAVTGFAAGAAALLAVAQVELGLAQDTDLGVERDCRGTRGRCRRDNQCCSLNCRLRRNNRRGRKPRGRCRCANEGARCQRDNGCCSGVCRNGNCRCGLDGDFCDSDGDCCSRQCNNGRCRCGRNGDRCDRNDGCCSNHCRNGFCSN